MDLLTGAALATGAADFLGGVFANRGNARQAALNRKFQERMSSTAAQRAVKDYTAAGLNPALAYDRPASSPGGSQAQLENPVGKAISTGTAARAAQAELEVTKQQAESLQAQAAKTKIDGANAILQGDLLGQQKLLNGQELAFRTAIQPHQTRAAALANMQTEMGLSKSEAEAAYYKFMGASGPAIEHLAGPLGDLAGGIMQLLPGGMATSSGKMITSLFKKPVPRRTGDWERAVPNPTRKPRGFTPNSPP